MGFFSRLLAKIPLKSKRVSDETDRNQIESAPGEFQPGSPGAEESTETGPALVSGEDFTPIITGESLPNAPEESVSAQIGLETPPDYSAESLEEPDEVPGREQVPEQISFDPEPDLELKKTGILDEPPKSDLSPQEMEDKLLGDLDSFFHDAEELADNFPQFETSRTYSPADDYGDWDSDFSDNQPEDLDDDPTSWPPLPETDSELSQVRDLLMNRELAQLSYLTRVLTRPAQRAEFISRVITEALLLRTRRDEKLNTVLAPTVEKIVSASVRRDPETLASQIFPAIGPAIRRSISETFVSKLQDLNSTLEKSLSLRGLKWRLEAMRVHKPFSEIVLLHTLLYHVEEIYLIHAATGLVLDHLISEDGDESRDADMVAGMFTAIQDFIRDSFQVAKSESLDTLRFGERTIFLRRTSQVYLACVVRGNPPESLNKDLQEALELMVVDCAEELENFNGDTTPFRKCRIYFQDFLKARFQDKPRKLPFVFRLVPAIVILFFIIIGLISHFQSSRQEKEAAMLEIQRTERQAWRQAAKKEDRLRLNEALGRLNAEPGLVVAQVAETTDGRWEIVCLKDSLAREPQDILTKEARLGPQRYFLNVRPFISLDEEIVQKRVREDINPLPTVSLSFESRTGELTITGTAPLGWIMEAKERALTIPGVQAVSTDRLADPRSSEMERLLSAINGVVIHFPTNSDEPVAEDRQVLVKAVDNLVALEKLAFEMQMSVNLVIYGHADSTGQDRRNFELSEQRTKTVAALLYARGSSMPISNYGLGSQFSARGEDNKPKDDPSSRRIELRVRLSQGAYGETGHP